MTSAPQPVVYLPHGGGPWPFFDFGLPQAELTALADYLKSLGAQRPKAILMVSAHWEAPHPTVMTHPRPPMLYDYRGFPPGAYELSWPAPGAPELAARVRELLRIAGIESDEDPSRGFDHGTFIPMMLAFPEADIPTTQLSLVRGLDPEAHLAIGRALAPLREEGVLILTSGMSFHNLRSMMSGQGATDSGAFHQWLRELVALSPMARRAELIAWEQAPGARRAHPREEHLIPLHVAAGAAREWPASVPYDHTYAGSQQLAVHFAPDH